MEPISVYRAAHLLPYLHYLERLGAPVERELCRARLPTLLADATDHYLPTIPTVAFLKAISRREGIDALGLRALQGMTMDNLSTEFVTMARQAPTLWTAIERFCEFAPVEDASLSVWTTPAPDDNIRFFSVTRCNLDDEGTLYEDWNLLLVLVGIVRGFAGPDWRPEVMAFRPDVVPGRFASEQFPNTRFLTGQPAAFISVPLALLGLPLCSRAKSRVGWAKSPRYGCSAQASTVQSELDLIGSLKAVLTTYVRDHMPSIEQAAEMAGTSVRTLQRRLSIAGVSYSDLVRDTLGSAAIRLLSETDASVMEIGLELGYDDPSHFARAFRRVAGMSPREFRKQQRVN